MRADKIHLIYEFGDFRVDPAAFRVTRGGRPVPLEPKAFEVLVFLLENPGRLVGKRELLDRVWPDAVVTESAMTRVIADLRRALGDAAREARYIETVPTKGYRFIAEVGAGTRTEPASPSGHGSAVTQRPPQPRPTWIVAAALAIALATAGTIGIQLLRARPPAPPRGSTARLTQVTDSLGLDIFPTFSPEGAQLAYSSDRSGSFELYVRQIAPGGREIQITADGRDNFQAAWSPNGRQIAYASRGSPGIWVVPALGGESRRLSTFGSRPAWSPDGAAIVFQSGGVIDLSATAPAASPPSSLFVVPAGGGEPLALTRPGSPAGGHGSAVFSPDGKDVFFVAWSLHGEIWSVSREGGAPRRILPRDGDVSLGPGSRRTSRRGYYDLAFAPRGDALYFTLTDESWLNATLWRSRAPKSPEGAWAEPERVTQDGTASLRQIAISPASGGTVAYAAMSITSNIWSLPVNPQTGSPSGDAILLTRGAGCRNTSPRYSPDGSVIAFVSCRAGASTDVWLMGRDGGNVRPLTDGTSETHFPSWFPDGSRIAFYTARSEGKGLWEIALEDRSTRFLVPIEAEVSPTRLSPDGRFVTYTVGAASSGLSAWIAPLDGQAPRRVTPVTENAGFACWSRDGKTLAVEVVRPTGIFVATVPADGGELRVLHHDPGLSWPSDWSPDGEKIAFAGQRNGTWNAYWLPSGGGSEHRLTANEKRRAIVRYPVWSPQGDRVAYELSETTANIWIMDLPR